MSDKAEDPKNKLDLGKKTVIAGSDPLSKMRNNGK